MDKLNRNQTLDIAKGLGIFLVVYGHSAFEIGHYIIYMFHMPLFFFISGLLHKDRDLKSCFLKKTCTLSFSYLLLFITVLVIDTISYGPEIVYEYSLLYPTHSAGPLRFILSLLESWLLFSIFLQKIKKYAFVASLLCSILGFTLSTLGIPLPLYIDSSLTVIIFYALGYYMKNILSKKFCSSICISSFFLSIVLLYGFYILSFKIMHYNCNVVFSNTLMPNYPLFFCSALIGIMGISMLSSWIDKLVPKNLSSFISEIGRQSLYIFGLHMSIMVLINNIFPQSIHDGWVFNIGCILSSMLILYILGVWFLEKVKCTILRIWI